MQMPALRRGLSAERRSQEYFGLVKALVLWQEMAGVANWRDMGQSARSGQALEALVQVTANP
jgi:hypothetical protein